MGLPLVLGLIAYVFIIGALTFWLLRSHSSKNRCLEADSTQELQHKPEEQEINYLNSGKKNNFKHRDR